MAIGQGYVSVTPLQLAQFAAMVANGGIRYRPQFVKEVEALSQGLGVAPGGGFGFAPGLLDGLLNHVLLFLKIGRHSRRRFGAGHLVGRVRRRRISRMKRIHAAKKPDAGEQACPKKYYARARCHGRRMRNLP